MKKMFNQIKNIDGKAEKYPIDKDSVVFFFTDDRKFFIYALYTKSDFTGNKLINVSEETFHEQRDWYKNTHEKDPKTNFVYADTDSIKYTGSVDWTEYNNARIAECMESGSYATDRKGITHYMGVFESEDNKETGFAYAQFRTMGAKKYAYKITDDGPTHVTISGVDKRKGGAELDKYNGLESFTEDFVFVDAGGTESVYSDDPEIKKIVIDGHELEITSNVSILPSTYTLGITGEYERIIKYGKSYLDNKNYV